MPAVYELQQQPVSKTVIRITSYNVCYTKLLRMPEHPGHICRVCLGNEFHQVFYGSATIQSSNHIEKHHALIAYQLSFCIFFQCHITPVAR